jgi:hypothetical protein
LAPEKEWPNTLPLTPFLVTWRLHDARVRATTAKPTLRHLRIAENLLALAIGRRDQTSRSTSS